jgi:hypothetical protein
MEVSAKKMVVMAMGVHLCVDLLLVSSHWLNAMSYPLVVDA